MRPKLVTVTLICMAVRLAASTIFLNRWAVEIYGGLHVANNVAQQNGFRNLGQIGSLENYYLFEQRRLVKRSINPSTQHHVKLEYEPRVKWLQQQTVRRRVKRDVRSKFSTYWNDPMWPRMWYLNRGLNGGVDMNVLGAWELGYSGQGVVVTILDDGMENNHTDLQQNYDSQASYDINDMDPDPMPRYDSSDDNRHGTRCAGQVAAVANNSRCSVGVAYGARIGGIRMLDGDVSDSVEAQALSFNPQHIDIYSASWGPEDNGRVIEGPAKLAREAFVQGVTKGRRGLGSIYIWASGNGGSRSDSCSCDGYTNSVYTLSVSSTSEHGTRPWYLEECSSTLAATYSSGENYRERKIVTTDLHNRCTDDHTGTSASAPLAAGICALALEANPELTWRDMQFIVIMAARTEPLRDAHWVTNGVGRKVSHRYGYGLMDAQAMVHLAERWTTVPQQRICTTDTIRVNQTIDRYGAMFKVAVDGCSGSNNVINYLEHVQARITLSYSRRGDLQISLISPNGTRSTLLPRRKDDFQPGKLDRWPFLSVFYWGEEPNGTWTLLIDNVGSVNNTGIFESWQLIFYGTETSPVNLKDTPVRRTKTSTVPTTMMADVKNASDINENTPSSISDNDTMLNASLVEPVVNTIIPTFTAGITATKQENVTPSINSSVTNATDIFSSITYGTATDSDVTWTELALPTTVTSSSPANGAEIELSLPTTVTSSSPANGAEIESTSIVSETVVFPTSANQQFINGSINCTTVISGCDSLQTNLSSDSLSLSSAATDSGPTREVFDTDYTTTLSINKSVGCDIECTESGCAGPLSTDCFSCKHAQISDTRQCVSVCPSVMFQNKTSGQCQSCPLMCDECSIDSSRHFLNCDKCVAGYYLLLVDGIYLCSEYCPPGYYADDVLGQCATCSLQCSECVMMASRCLQCSDGFDMIDFNCLPRCEMAEYREHDGSCHHCDSTCATCVGSSSADCIQCANGLWYEDSYCVNNCSDGYFSNLINDEKFCHLCYPSCLTCFGPSELDCFTCFHPLKLIGTTCREECPTGFYESEVALCYPCDVSCDSCYGPDETNCLSCQSHLVYFANQCIDSCPAGYFEAFTNDTTSSMALFNIENTNDRQPLSEEVDELASNLINKNNNLVTLVDDNTVSRVVSRMISSSDSPSGLLRRCEQCHSSCSVCSGSLAVDCTDCPEGLYLSDGYCVQHCNYSYYASGGRCEHCDPACKTCIGPSYTHCTSCHVGWYLHSALNYCVTSCPDGFYLNVEMQSCIACSSECATCEDASVCTSCVFPHVLDEQRCKMCCIEEEGFSASVCCVCDESTGLCIQAVASDMTSTLTSTELTSAGALLNSTSSSALAVSHHVSSSPSPFRTDMTETPHGVTSPTTSPLPITTSSFSSYVTSLPSRFATTVVMTSDVAHSSVVTTASIVTSVTVSEVRWTADVTQQADTTAVEQTVHLSTAELPVIFPPYTLWLLFIAVAIVTLSVLIALLVFFLVRARSQHKLCWTKHRCYLPVPLLYQNGSNNVRVDANLVVVVPLKVSTELAPLTSV